MQSWNATFVLFFFSYSLWGGGGGGVSGRVRALNLTVPLGSGRTISGTGRVRASVLSPCRPLVCVFVFKAILASVAIFMAKNIKAELYHVFLIYFC